MARTTTPAAPARTAEASARIARADAERAVAESRARIAGALAERVPQLLAGGYANAKRNRLRPGPAPRGGSANYQLDTPDRAKLRAEAQQLSRDNPIARAIRARLVELIGAGRARVQAKTSNAGWNSMAEAWFARWAEEWCDVCGVATLADLLDQVVGAAIDDGDCGVVLVQGGRLQLIEGERIINPSGKQDGSATASDTMIVGGVEVDKVGRPVGYHVGDFNPQGSSVNVKTTRFDPADFVLAISPRNLRIGQKRGEPLFSGTLHLFEQLDEYIVSTLIAARMGTLFGLIVTAENPAEKQAGMLSALSEDGSSVDDTGRGETQALRAGGIFTGKPGETVTQTKPEFPTATFDPFTVAILREIGADTGLPIEHFMFDTTRTTFHGGRAATAIAYRGIERWQRWAVQILRKVWKFAIAHAIRTRQIPDNPEFALHGWTMPPLPPFDPKTQVETALLSIQGNLSTGKAEAAALNGSDWDDNVQENARERDEMQALGLASVTLPGQRNGDGGMPPDPASNPASNSGDAPVDGSQP